MGEVIIPDQQARSASMRLLNVRRREGATISICKLTEEDVQSLLCADNKLQSAYISNAGRPVHYDGSSTIVCLFVAVTSFVDLIVLEHHISLLNCLDCRPPLSAVEWTAVC